MLNLNLNTLSSKLTEQPRGVFQGLVSASFVLYGGGGGGSTNNGGGGGGGAGMVVSGALQIVPNVTYNVIVGSGASASLFNSSSNNPNKAETSWMYGSNIVSTNPFTASAGGGFCAGTGSAGPSGTWAYRAGGASGAGFVYLSPSVSSSYPSFVGGTTNLDAGGAGGAGSTQNGLPGNIGQGGSGSLIISSSFQTYGYYSASVVVSPYSGSDGTIGYALGAAGGGGGARLSLAQEAPGGFFGGGTQVPLSAFGSNGFGPGAGGAGLGFGGAPAGNGGDGRAYIIYCGVPKMDVTNARTIYDTTLNTTVHIFDKGTGSFQFNFEKYGSIPGCQ